jgi:hypothetical protein
MKSTITALALNHFGPDWAFNRMPASWNDTPATLEARAFLIKDAPLVVDDYARDAQVARTHDQKAELLVRNWANRTGRGRRDAKMKAQRNFPPRGLVISSGEQLPSGESIISRLFPVKVERSDLAEDQRAIARLDRCQAEAGRYGHAMAGYLLWLRARWEDLTRSLPDQCKALRDRDDVKNMGHLRIPSALATLYIGFDLAMRFYVDQGILTEAAAQERRDAFWVAMKEGAEGHKILVHTEDPIERFVRILSDSFAQGAIWVEGLGGVIDTRHVPNAEQLGFMDRDWLYLLGESTLAYVQRYCRNAGDPFPLNRNALYSGLVEAGLAIPGPEYTTMQLRVGDNKHNVLRIHIKPFGISPRVREGSEAAQF